MSFTRISRAGGVVTQPSNATWQRPSDWLTIPDIPVGQQKVYGIIAVGPENQNWVAFNVSGAYTVDWGDGTVTNYASGVMAQRNIQWASVPANTVTSEGYRQALVTITPQVGSNLSTFGFNQLPTGYSAPYVNPWREITMRAPLCTSLQLSHVNQINALRWFTFLGTSSINNTACFYAARWLRGITGTQWTASNVNFQDWFNSCFALQTLPAIDTSAATNFSGAFISCYSLSSFPLLNTANVTTFSNAFNSCYALTSFPLIDTGKVTSMSNAFANCINLQTVPLFNTSLTTDFTSMFFNCIALRTLPLFDTSKGTVFQTMFQGCTQLQSVPLFVTSAGTNFSSMFAGCGVLKTIPQFDYSQATTLASMFQNCSALETLPAFNSAKAINLTNLIFACSALRGVDVDCSAIPNAAGVTQFPNVGGNGSLRTVFLRGLKFASTSPGMVNQALSAQALNDFYTALGTATGTQTISVTGNPGSGSSTTSIATAKGWTIIGG